MNIFRNTLVVLLAVSFVITIGFAQKNKKENQPYIKIENNKYKAGKVLRGTQLKHKFKIKNTGGDDLRIEKVKPG